MKEQEMKEKFAAYIQGVELDEHGQPRTLARWGYVKVKFKGKVYLAAASPEEAQEMLAEIGIKDDPKLLSVCLGGGEGGTPCSCNGNCVPQGPNSGYICLCNGRLTKLSWEKVG